jgi:hypothetical protein
VISSENVPSNREASDDDFTVAVYHDLLALAKEKYEITSYDAIPWGGRFLLWRHDCDYSLNRANALARIEAEHGVRATYFLNPRSEFYNLFERGQQRLVQEIIGMGHQIGLHFDAGFHDTLHGQSLSALVRDEANLLEQIFGVRLAAFSFHNPLAAHLQCEDEAYGGLTNCYSLRFKTQVPYCSDSNGYWRFRRLRDVLASATDPCLQVLTHPEWWQEVAMPPRQRIFRSAYGRARATMSDYDATISAHGRENLSGAASALTFLRDLLPERHALLDYLWMSGELATVFAELWHLNESQVNSLCRAALVGEWQVSFHEVKKFFESSVPPIGGEKLFEGVFGQSWQIVSEVDADAYSKWRSVRNQLLCGGSAPKQLLEEGCVFLCEMIGSLAAWGRVQMIGFDGLTPLEDTEPISGQANDGWRLSQLDEHIDENHNRQQKRWELFKEKMEKAHPVGPAA